MRINNVNFRELVRIRILFACYIQINGDKGYKDSSRDGADRRKGSVLPGTGSGGRGSGRSVP